MILLAQVCGNEVVAGINLKKAALSNQRGLFILECGGSTPLFFASVIPLALTHEASAAEGTAPEACPPWRGPLLVFLPLALFAFSRCAASAPQESLCA